jgi:preprotein translocase subunit YajC
MMYRSLLALTTQNAPSKPAAQPNLLQMLLPLFLIFIFIYYIMLRPRKEQKQREQMLGGIKKFDKVITIGGVLGTVVDIRDDEIVLKVDDNTNTRIRFARSAIQRVVSSAEAEKTGEK